MNTELTFEVEIEYVCTSKGCPEQGPTYGCGGTPAEPPEFNITVMFAGHDITKQLSQSQYDEVERLVLDDYGGG